MTQSLDLFSTGHTFSKRKKANDRKTDRQIYDECVNNAPYFAYQIDGKKWGVVQGCCNDWNCPRCGQQRAREEYGRIVVGARHFGASNPLTMLTITCLGRELSVEDAEENYLLWTDRFLSKLRNQTKRANKEWAYASVTERQKRGHPHSHYITTYRPKDAILVKKGQPKFIYTTGESIVAKHDTLQSKYTERASVAAGLGWMYDVSDIRSVEGASRYAAKYLFKETIFDTKWPKGWRRVRYSQNWPKLLEVKSDAMILMTAFDWLALAKKAVRIITKDDGARQVCERALRGNDVIIS